MLFRVVYPYHKMEELFLSMEMVAQSHFQVFVSIRLVTQLMVFLALFLLPTKMLNISIALLKIYSNPGALQVQL